MVILLRCSGQMWPGTPGCRGKTCDILEPWCWTQQDCGGWCITASLGFKCSSGHQWNAVVVSRQSTFVQTQSQGEVWPLHGQCSSGGEQGHPSQQESLPIHQQGNKSPSTGETQNSSGSLEGSTPSWSLWEGFLLEMLEFFRMSLNRNFKNVEDK